MIVLAKLYQRAIQSGVRVIRSVWAKKITDESPLSGPFGYDSNPLNDSIAVVVDTGNNADTVVVGFVAKQVIEDLLPGESGLYATDADGNVVTTLILRGDGTIEMGGTENSNQKIGNENTEKISIGGEGDFMVRYSKLQEAFNELQEKFNDLVLSFNSHTHPTAPTGPVSPPTPSPTVPAEISESNIEPSKIGNVVTNTNK